MYFLESCSQSKMFSCLGWHSPTGLSHAPAPKKVLKAFPSQDTEAGRTEPAANARSLTVPLCLPQTVWHLTIPIWIMLLSQSFSPLPVFKSFPPKKNITKEKSAISVIILCFKCGNRSVILCLVSKPSIGCNLAKRVKFSGWVGELGKQKKMSCTCLWQRLVPSRVRPSVCTLCPSVFLCRLLKECVSPQLACHGMAEGGHGRGSWRPRLCSALTLKKLFDEVC